MNWANALTITRILLCIPLVLIEPFSLLFYVIYFVAGITDVADGYIARCTGKASKHGAMLDSVADVAFYAVLIYVATYSLAIPAGILIWATMIAFIRLLSYGIGYIKYHAFAALHTYANKAVGLLMFGFPILYGLCGVVPAAIAICFAANMAALEELLINITSVDLKRNEKSIWGKGRSI